MKDWSLDLDHPRLKELLEAHQPVHNEFNLATLKIWGDSVHYYWREEAGTLWLYNQASDYLYFPMVPTSQALDIGRLKKVSDEFHADGKKGVFYLAPAEYVEQYRGRLAEVFVLQLDEVNSDYLYEAQALVDLKGKLLQKKKNHVNQFLAAYPRYQARELRAGDRDLCLQIVKEWCEIKTCPERDYQSECRAVEECFEFFVELGLRGQLLEVDGKGVAFAIYARQNRGMATVIIEKAALTIKGASQMINWLTAQAIQQEGYALINRCQDLGLPGLRQAKQTYEPKQIYKVFMLARPKDLLRRVNA